MSNSKKVPYFFNSETKESSWDTPPGITEEQIKDIPGAELLTQKPTGASGPKQVRASHLLVKHNGSRRPSSWKEVSTTSSTDHILTDHYQPEITRSKEEAIAILREYESQINGDPEKFKELATQHSDCSSHSAGGDLGWFGPGQMQKPFEEGAYSLEIGKISDVVSSDSGVHLIMRTG